MVITEVLHYGWSGNVRRSYGKVIWSGATIPDQRPFHHTRYCQKGYVLHTEMIEFTPHEEPTT